jgi:hypothetical protein
MQEGLSQASNSGNGAQIQNLSRDLARAQAELTSNIDLWESAQAELETNEAKPLLLFVKK